MRTGHGRFRRRLKPRKLFGADACRAEVEQQLGQLAAADLRQVVIGAAMVVLRSVEPDGTAWAGAAGAARALLGGRFADALQLKGGQAGDDRIAGYPGGSAIDDYGHAIAGDGALR